jgi:Cu(I)/Ag(I) efflux system membrane fusion protein
MKQLLAYSIFLIALFMAATGCTNRKQVDHTEHNQKNTEVLYTCPMHPEIIRNAPGACPICGMDLVKKETGNAAIAEVELESLLKPVNEFVISTVPLTTLQQREENVELKVVGRVDYDTRQVGAVSSRVKGRIEKLYVRYLYQPVRKGQKVMDIYSPELVTAQQNLIFLLRNDPANTSLINAARDRLTLMGMSASQVAEVARSQKPDYTVAVFSNYSGFVTDLNTASGSKAGNMNSVPGGQELSIKEGMYVQSGQAVFSIYDNSRAWILLELFPEQQSLVHKGDAVRIVPESAPHQDFRAQIDYVEPVFRPGSKTLTVRVFFNNAGLRLPIGSRVTASIFGTAKLAFWLPREAVLSLGRDKIVFLKKENGFKVHSIRSGIQLNGHIEVSGGLTTTDSVAMNAQFLIDNEAFIKMKNP